MIDSQRSIVLVTNLLVLGFLAVEIQGQATALILRVCFYFLKVFFKKKFNAYKHI
jgi:hypothetical protein